MNIFSFESFQKDKTTHARVGVIHTPHGDIETPSFVPVGTQATVKSLTPDELTELQVRLFFVNTYHMYLRPGLEVIQEAGGLHRFMGWDGPIITDSGGFQVFSLGRKKFQPHYTSSNSDFSSRLCSNNNDEVSPTLVRITDDGVTFRSHWDGSEHVFTPESSMQYQWTLGSDIHIAFDDCTPYGVTKKQAETSMERTHRWGQRSLLEHNRQWTESMGQNKPYQALYGSIQGSVFQDLREKSAKFITALPFDGYAVGGVSVGENKQEMRDVMDWVLPYLPADKPRHLLGVGEIDDIFALVEHGFDTFDCVQPTRLARMGRVYCHREAELGRSRGDLSYKDCFVAHAPRNDRQCEIDILKAEFAHDLEPIEKGCGCYTCQHFSRAYIHHLFKVRELLGYRLATIHNIHFINTLVANIRLAIREGSLVALKEKYLTL